MEKTLIVNYPEDINDSRLIILSTALENRGVNVEKLINPIWGDYSFKTKLLKKPHLIFRKIFSYLKFLLVLLGKIRRNQYSLIIIGYPAYFEAFFLCFFLKKENRKKMYVDFFISLYDTIILDRALYPVSSYKSKIFFHLDRYLLRLPVNFFADTNENINYFSELFKVSKNKFKRVLIGSKLLINKVEENDDILQNKIFNIGWAGVIIPLHGIDKIIDAAIIIHKLYGEKVIFHIVGNGPSNELSAIENKVKQSGLSNIILYGLVDYERAIQILQSCHICLGIFGNSRKSKSVIPFKIYDYLALNKIVITQDSPALSEIIKDFNNIFLVDNTGEAITNKIKELIDKSATYKNNSFDRIKSIVFSDCDKLIQNL